MRGTVKSSLQTAVTKASLVPALALLASFASPAAAQQDTDAVTTYRLPDPNRTPTPRAQGPVDPDNPIPAPSGAPTLSPAPAPAPRIDPSPPPSTTPTPTPQPSERRQPARPAATPPAAKDHAQPTPAAPSSSPELVPAPVITSSAASSAPDAEPTPTPTRPEVGADSASSSKWLIPGVIGAGVIGLGAFLLLRRRRKTIVTQDEPLFEPVSAEPDPEPSALVPSPVAPAIQIPPSIPAALVAEPLAIATVFTARAVRLSLVYATVQYELEIANAGTAELPALQIRADLASAHASLGTREQLAPAPEQLQAQHALAMLLPGEIIILKGEVRVPLQHVRTVTRGTAQFFVPLVRFAILSADGSGLRRVYTTGPRDQGSGTIASVRLDAGPRNLRDLDAREIEAARGFALDPEIAHS